MTTQSKYEQWKCFALFVIWMKIFLNRVTTKDIRNWYESFKNENSCEDEDWANADSTIIKET